MPWLKPEIAIKTRIAEARKADKIIGGSGVRFFDLKEGKFADEAEKKNIKSKIQRMILSRKPVKVFTHCPEDPHPDHRAVYHIVMQALDEIKHDCDVFSFDIWNPINIKKRNNPRLVVDITGTFDQKIASLKCFESQKLSLISLLPSVYTKAFFNGLNNGYRFAEVFYKIH